MRYRPSGDMACGYLFTPDSRRTDDAPLPLAAFHNRSLTPFRVELKTRRLPSGNHVGFPSYVKSKVSRCGRSPSISSIQMSVLPVVASVIITATRFPSGEMRGDEYAAGSPSAETSLPLRLSHIILDPPTV